MRVIAGPRQSGKTTKLVEVAKATNGYILVHNEDAGAHLVRLGLSRDRILRLHDFRAGNINGRTLNGPLYVDNIELVFNGIMSMLAAGKFSGGVQVGTISLSKEDIDSMINDRVIEGIILSDEP